MKDRFLLHWVLPLFIAAGAIFLAYWFIVKAPKAKPKPAVQRKATIVEVIKPELGNFNVEIDTVGEVIPYNSLNLTTKISGEVVELSPNLEPGGIVNKGELLVRIDDRDYQLIKMQREAALQQAKSDLKMEHGRQVVAKNDLKLIKRSSKFTQEQLDLALRKPQLMQYQAAVTKAQASLDEAKLAIERTKIFAPWDAVVVERNISIGTNLTAQQTIASLIDNSKYRIKTSIAANKLPFINIGNENSKVQIKSNASQNIINGEIISVLPSLTSGSRMNQVLIEVDNSNSQDISATSLRINDYVQVKILGKQLDNVYQVPRTYVHDGNSIWIMRTNKLTIILPKIIHEDKNFIYFNSLIKSGDMLITSILPSAVEGMLLATPEQQNNHESASQSKKQSLVEKTGDEKQ